ncbi:hypothetical protein KPH14_006320 [Odynerus spinipes]|uniref:3-hydroxyisobutyryl-CoA hydrolase, mitochondrial n=1 Tax=Odynerus spinipes TaxID=1348599 RepID=A0AAD9VVH7_9HYME|nr:hypothetical protein KPH14_006320 [Odynerus spinipes]
MQRITKELIYMGARRRNKIEFLVRALSSVKAERDNANKLNDQDHIRDVKVKSNIIHEKPGNIENVKVVEHKRFEDSSVLFHNVEDKGLIILNRPKSLNVLNTVMCGRMINILKEWESSKKLVIIKGSGDRAFCCGGDLNIMKSVQPENATLPGIFFNTAYKLYHLVGTYKIPIVAFMNNITMGGGAGISIHNKYRVVTERSIFAMPEATIGFFPDGGCTYVFPRLQGQLGLFLGLTGYRLKGIDIIYSGIATHYILAERLQDLEQELLSCDSMNIDEILEKYRANTDGLEFSLAPYMDKINTYFSADSVEEIIGRLQNDGSEWSRKIIKTLEKMSPASLKITHRALREGKELRFDDCIKMEYRLARSLINTYSDFYEGFKIIIEEKGRTPNWQQKSLREVTPDDVLKRFVSLSPELELKLEDKS